MSNRNNSEEMKEFDDSDFFFDLINLHFLHLMQIIPFCHLIHLALAFLFFREISFYF